MTDPSLLPPSINDARYRAFEALGNRLEDIDLAPLLVYRVREADDDVLRSLSWQFHVQGLEGWDLARTHNQRIALIEQAILQHRHRGTPGGVELALSLAGYPSAHIHERVGTAGAPPARYDGNHHLDGLIRGDGRSVAAERGWALFGLSFDIADVPPNSTELSRILQVVQTTKRASTHLAWTRIEAATAEEIPAPSDDATLDLLVGIDDPVADLPRYDGRHRLGTAMRPRYDGRLKGNGSGQANGRPILLAGHVRAGQSPVTDQLLIEIIMTQDDLVDRPARYDGSVPTDGDARATGRWVAWTDILDTDQVGTPPQPDWDDATGWDDGLGWIDG